MKLKFYQLASNPKRRSLFTIFYISNINFLDASWFLFKPFITSFPLSLTLADIEGSGIF